MRFEPRVVHARRPAARASLAVPPAAERVVRAPGQPLDVATRRFMEPRFGHDFSHVRVHVDAEAAASAEAVRARAFTVGSDVAFAASEYAPGTSRGRDLLAHELAHTIQQEGSAGTPSRSDADGQFEESADVAARAVTRGEPVPVNQPASGIRLARKPPDDDERAKAVADAMAVIERIDKQLADADKDDEPETKPKARPSKPPSRFSPGGFTDEEADKVLREAQDQVKLGSMALTLAERQARRREFWAGNPSYNSADVKEAFDLDLYWDPNEESFIRQPYVSKAEAVVMADPDAKALYDNRYFDLTENKPKKKSRFDRMIGFVCDHTEPCSSNMEQFRRDRESGMSRDEAINRGMARLTINVETMMLPTPGPSGPIPFREGPSGMPFQVPATEGPTLGGEETPAPPTSKPLLTKGPKSPEPPQADIVPTAETPVPEPIVDEPTNRIRPVDPDVGERVGDFRISGEKSELPLKGKTFEREIWGIRSEHPGLETGKVTKDIGVGPLLKLFRILMDEARAAGATSLRIKGRAITNKNILKMKGLVEKKYGGTFRQEGPMSVEIEVPL